MVIQKLLLEEGIKRGVKSSREYSKSVMGYDFIGLMGRLFIFFITAFLINSYMTATITGGNWLNSFGSFFGLKFPQTLPQWVIDLFTVGFQKGNLSISFWQIVQIISILLVVVEYTQYTKSLKLKDGETPNITTTAVFTMLALVLSLITFPEMIQKIRERGIVNNGA